MDFSWSTPLRRNGHTSLSLIPNEIYLAIFDCIASSSKPLPEQHIKTFSALAHLFAPSRFRVSRKTTWARQIVANTEPAKSIALYVKECHFKEWYALKEVQRFLSPFSTLYCRAMARMTNIRKVEFHDSFVKKEHWEAMAALKQLDSLLFICCFFTENPPDNQELSVRVVKLFNSPIPHIVWPIATSNLRTLETDDLEAVLELVTARQLAIKNFVLHRRFELKTLLQVFEQLPDLERVTIGFREELVVSPLIGVLSLKKIFTRLRSFTIDAPFYCAAIPRHITEKMLSAICDGPGTLPSLENLGLMFFGGITPTLDIVSDNLESTIIPAFPNLKCIRTPNGDMRLEKGDWKRSYS